MHTFRNLIIGLLFILSGTFTHAQSHLKIIFQPYGLTVFAGPGLSTGLGYEKEFGRHLLNVDAAASAVMPGNYFGCGQGAASLTFRPSYNYRVLNTRLKIYLSTGLALSVYRDSNSECGSREVNWQPNAHVGGLFKLRLSKKDKRVPLHLNLNLAGDVGPIYRRPGYSQVTTYSGFSLVPITYLSLSLGL